jgi:hypothetical protein
MAKPELPRGKILLLLFTGLVILALASGYFLFQRYKPNLARSGRALTWLRNPGAHLDWAIQGGERCGDAPFLLPTDGFVGFLWNDSFRIGHHHQGVDIFGGTEVGVTPVVAAYAGYLTRMPDWKSSVIIRIPDDPLQPGRQIWTYYTHMADSSGSSYITPEFPPGTQEIFVEAGTLLGYQGNFSGDPGNPVGVHLHFSIVMDDGRGKFLNELKIENTLDPSRYFGLPLNAVENGGVVPVCGWMQTADQE